MQQLELEKLREKGEEESCIIDFSKQLSLDKGSNDENTAVTGEDNDAKMYPEANRNKKNRKKNKKWLNDGSVREVRECREKIQELHVAGNWDRELKTLEIDSASRFRKV